MFSNYITRTQTNKAIEE